MAAGVEERGGGGKGGAVVGNAGGVGGGTAVVRRQPDAAAVVERRGVLVRGPRWWLEVLRGQHLPWCGLPKHGVRARRCGVVRRCVPRHPRRCGGASLQAQPV